MKNSEVKNLSTEERFLFWISEREKIRLAKERKQPKPWTNNETLRNYRFCNVRRMDDKVSRWLMRNWYQTNFNHKNMVLACVMARHFNLPSSLEEVGFPKKWCPDIVKEKLRYAKDNGRAVFNGAYIITGKYADQSDKIGSVVDVVCSQFHPRPKLCTNSLEACHKQLMGYQGLGSFMAGQIVCDLRHAIKGDWIDKQFWAPIGPGSRRGMNRFLERDIKSSMRQPEFIENLQEVIEMCMNSLPDEIVNRLEAMDFQNCFCEWDKFERILWGQGKPKQRYKGT